jgi:hypothetical protein
MEQKVQTLTSATLVKPDKTRDEKKKQKNKKKTNKVKPLNWAVVARNIRLAPPLAKLRNITRPQTRTNFFRPINRQCHIFGRQQQCRKRRWSEIIPVWSSKIALVQ